MAVPGRYGVSYVLAAPEALAVVDVGSAADVARILAAVRWMGRDPSEIRYVIPTHLHFDHMMGLDALAEATGASVLMGARSAAAVRGDGTLRWPPHRELARLVALWVCQGMPLVPTVDLLGGLDFGFPWARYRFHAPLAPALADGEDVPGLQGWRLLEAPGHTDDAVVLHHAGAGYLIAGDTIRSYFGGEWNTVLVDREVFLRTRRRLCTEHVQTVFPGHGPVIEGDDVLRKLRVMPFYLP